MATRDSLAAWLRDAHAMEGQAIKLLETQIERLESYPEALPRLRQHLDETNTPLRQTAATTGRHPGQRACLSSGRFPKDRCPSP